MAYPIPAGVSAAQWFGADLQGRINIMRFIYPNDPGGWGWNITALVRDWVGEHYGAMAAYLDDPEVGPILMHAGEQGWSAERLTAAIQQTNFWKSTTDAQRQFDLLKRTDPATAQKTVDQTKSVITSLLSREGVLNQYSDARILDLATQMARNGVQGDQLPKFVLADVQFNPTMAGGTLGSQQTEIKNQAAQYAIPISDQMAFDWAKGIEMGTQTKEGLTDYLKGQATAAYSSDEHLSNMLKEGYTVRQVLDPQLQAAGQLLGVDPDSIDLRDQKWTPIVQYASDQGTRTRTLDETQRYVRTLDDYWQTTNGEQDAAKFVTGLAKQFGKA